MSPRESILSRIKKLQALTTDRGATPEEAAAAAAKVQALLFEHNLEQADVDMSGPEEKAEAYEDVSYTHESAKQTTINWRRKLLHRIAKHNFCDTCFTSGTRRQYITGKRSNVDVVIYLYESVARQIEEMAERAAKAQPGDERKVFKRNFALGAVSTVALRLYEQRKADERRATNASHATNVAKASQNAIMLRNTELEIKGAFAKFHPKVASADTGSINSGLAYSAGQRAGHTVSLNRGVAARTPSVKIGGKP
jgi:hypothetical protein